MNREEAERGGDGELVSKPRGIAWALLAILLSSFSQYTLILQQGIYLIVLPSQYYDDFMAFIISMLCYAMLCYARELTVQPTFRPYSGIG